MINIEEDNSNSVVEKYGRNPLLHALAKMSGFEEEVPDMDTFIDDPYYLGKVLGQGLYPIWRKAAKEVYPSPYHSPYNEVVLSGAIGLGKSTFALLITLYDLCRMMSLKDPHKHFNLIESTVISFALLNATKGLAGAVLYGQFIEWVEASPYFKSKLASGKHRTLFKKNIDVSVGSRGRDYLGQATAGAIFSEINDMTVVGGQAEDNLDTISTRRNSRFGGKNKEILGHLILDSSNKGNRSFIDARLDEKRKKGVTDFIVFSYSHWEAKWHLGGYSSKFIQVYAGDENRDPFIVTDKNRHLLITLKQERVIDVPIEHEEEFRINIIKSLRDLAGVSTFSTFSFISSSEVLKSVFSRPNIVTQSIISLDFFDELQKLLKYIDIKMCIFLCKAPRFIHIDLGLKNDSTGIACTYLDGYKDIIGYDPTSGSRMITREPIFITEWVMEIQSVPGQEVPIYKIKNFILEAKKMGYPIYKVSTDGFQSSNLRQDLTLNNISTDLISVDRTKDPYNLLRNAMLEGRLTAPDNEKLRTEIRDLVDVGPKYDHESDGSKDIADAVCGSVWSCSQNLHKAGATMDSVQLNKSIDTLIGSRDMSKRFQDILSNTR